MKEISADHNFKMTSATVGFPLLFVLIIWVVYWFEIRFGYDFNSLGVGPHSIEGLKGIFFSPFIHGSIEHLYSNTLPLLILSVALFYFYRALAWKVLLIGILLVGLLTWLIGEEGSVHIGASGVVYLLTSFLFFKGIWSKHYRLIALSLIVVFVYGSLVWGVLPGEEGISWEGHLAGFLSGMILAFVYKKEVVAPIKKYEWEKETYKEEDDEFMKHFDEDGNFIPSSELYPEDEEEFPNDQQEGFTVHYEFIPSKKKKEE